MITKAKEFPCSLAEERLSLRQNLAQLQKASSPAKKPTSRTGRSVKKPMAKKKPKAEAKLQSQPQQQPPSVVQPEIPPPHRRTKPELPTADIVLSPETAAFDLVVNGQAIGFRGDVYQLVPGVPVQSVRINGFHFPIKEVGATLVAQIRGFVTFNVEILMEGTATKGLRFHVVAKK